MGSSVRLPDWHARLNALIAERQAQPFTWGHVDCCLWVADAVQAMTGRDPAADVRAHYSTARGAKSVLRQVGGLEGAGARCGLPIGRLFAAAGDVGIVNDGASDLLAVCIGEHWMVTTKSGLGTLPFQSVRSAWRVA